MATFNDYRDSSTSASTFSAIRVGDLRQLALPLVVPANLPCEPVQRRWPVNDSKPWWPTDIEDLPESDRPRCHYEGDGSHHYTCGGVSVRIGDCGEPVCCWWGVKP